MEICVKPFDGDAFLRFLDASSNANPTVLAEIEERGHLLKPPTNKNTAPSINLQRLKIIMNQAIKQARTKVSYTNSCKLLSFQEPPYDGVSMSFSKSNLVHNPEEQSFSFTITVNE